MYASYESVVQLIEPSGFQHLTYSVIGQFVVEFEFGIDKLKELSIYGVVELIAHIIARVVRVEVAQQFLVVLHFCLQALQFHLVLLRQVQSEGVV